MHNFRYVTKKEWKPVKEELLKLIKLVQDEVREHFTFQFEFIGSASRNTITIDEGSNRGYDFDVNLRVNDPDDNYSPQEIKQILITAFNKYGYLFEYDYAEDSNTFTLTRNKALILGNTSQKAFIISKNEWIPSKNMNFGKNLRVYI